MEWIERDGWTRTRRPAEKLARLDPSEVRGVAVHYTGSTVPLGSTASLALSVRRLEDERRFHTAAPPAGRGWTDIAYQVAIDVEGRVFDCRGIGYRSAANGNATVNRQFGAVTWLLGVGDTPTPAMVEAFAWWREAHWLQAYPHATAIVGHRDLYQTSCPGDPTYDLIRSGRLAARPAIPVQEDDMPLSNDDVERIAQRTAELVTGIGARNPVVVDAGTGAAHLKDGRDIDAIPTVIGEIQSEQRRQGDVLQQIAARLDQFEAVAGSADRAQG